MDLTIEEMNNPKKKIKYTAPKTSACLIEDMEEKIKKIEKNGKIEYEPVEKQLIEQIDHV